MTLEIESVTTVVSSVRETSFHSVHALKSFSNRRRGITRALNFSSRPLFKLDVIGNILAVNFNVEYTWLVYKNFFCREISVERKISRDARSECSET